MCDGAVLEIADVGNAGDVDDGAFQLIVSSVRNSLGDGVQSDTIYGLSDLVKITGLPEAIGIRAITEILHRGMSLTPATPPGKSLMVLSEDEYALAETRDTRHSIVTVPLPFLNLDNEVQTNDWFSHATELSNLMKQVLADDLDMNIVDDMAVDRALCSGASLSTLRNGSERGRASISRAIGLSGPFAKIAPKSCALVFVAKRGAACSHMSRTAISRALSSKGIRPPPASASRKLSCLYAEYSLRVQGLVARTEASSNVRSDAHENDAHDNNDSASVNHTVRA